MCYAVHEEIVSGSFVLAAVAGQAPSPAAVFRGGRPTGAGVVWPHAPDEAAAASLQDI